MTMRPELLHPTGALLLEDLDPRDLLWACLVGQVMDLSPAEGADPGEVTLRDRLVRVWTRSPRHRFDLLIQGTEMQASAGCPSFLAGNICSGDGPSSTVIGRYEEKLTPTVVDGRVVGTRGQSTFAWFVDAGDPLIFETITTESTSLIQDTHPVTGEWELGSAGTITSSAGVFPDLRGGFISSSTLNLSTPSQWRMRVHFSVNRPVAPRLAALGKKWASHDPEASTAAPALLPSSEPFAPIRAGLKEVLSPAARPNGGADNDLDHLIAQVAAALRQKCTIPSASRNGNGHASARCVSPLLDFVVDARTPVGPRNGKPAPALPNGGIRQVDGGEVFLPTPAAVRREAALILQRPLSPELQHWATRYGQVGKRSPYLWRWCRHGIDLTALPCLAPDLQDELGDTKVLGIMFNVLLDDVADRQGDEDYLEQLLGFPFDAGLADFSRFAPGQRLYADFAVELWREIETRTRRYPCYAVYAELFRHDHYQMFNSMRYSHILNRNLGLLNLLEHDLYLPYQMNMMISATFDLMGSPHFCANELGRLREAVWHAQCMGRIGNLVTTWERELGDGDYTSGVYARAVSHGDLTVPELLTGDRERIGAIIRQGGHEAHFLRRWQQHRQALLALRSELHSVDLQPLVDGLQRLLCSQLASRGDY